VRLDRVEVPGRRRRMVAAALWLAVVILAQAAAAQNDVQRSLLETLGMDIPARPLRAPSLPPTMHWALALETFLYGAYVGLLLTVIYNCLLRRTGLGDAR